MDTVLLESCGRRGSLHGIAKVIFGELKPVLVFAESLDTSNSFFLRAIPGRQHVCRGRECIYACFTFFWPSFLTLQLPIERGPTSTAHRTIVTAPTRQTWA